MLFVRLLPQRYNAAKTAGILAAALPLFGLVQWLIGIVPLSLWIPGMIVALVLMYATIWLCCRLNFCDHRQTNRHSYSRQACAEKLRRNENGAFLQAEVTSCGLNDGPLKGKGRYEARIACNLWGKNGTGRYDGPFPKWRLRNHPYFTQDGPDREDSGNQYIANMRDGAVAGFKYFAFKDAAEIKVHCTGSANGRLQVSTAPDFSTLCADIFIKNGSQVGEKVTLTIPDGTYPLYFRFTGSGKMNFHWFELQ